MRQSRPSWDVPPGNCFTLFLRNTRSNPLKTSERRSLLISTCSLEYILGKVFTGLLASLVLTSLYSGQCAEHFQKMLIKYPPQTSSREAASQWGCFVHNIVNEKLHKEIFDCNEISDKYNCGCADDEKDGEGSKDSKASGDKSKSSRSSPEKMKLDTSDILGEPEIDHSPDDMVRGG